MLALASPVIASFWAEPITCSMPDMGVAGRVAAGGDAAEHHGHGEGRAGIARRVDAVAADQIVGASRALQHVVIVAAVEHVVAAAAIEDIVAGLAEDLVVLGAGVDRDHCRCCRSDCRLRRHRPRRSLPSPPLMLSAPASPDRASSPPLPRMMSLPQLAADDVAGGVTGEGVGVAGAVQVLDAGQYVALGVAARGDEVQQVDRDPGQRALVVGEVRAAAAVEIVGAGRRP